MFEFSREATIIIGEPAEILVVLRRQLPTGTVYAEFVTLGIKDSWLLKGLSARRLGRDEKQFWVLSAAALTEEAQNALLKTLEEPPRGHYFVLVTPALADLLPTLLSRCELILPGGLAAADDRLAARQFLTAAPEARLALVQKLVKTHEGEPALTRQLALKLVNGIESELHQTGVTAQNLADFAALAQARDYLYDRAAAPRLILDHLALVLPLI